MWIFFVAQTEQFHFGRRLWVFRVILSRLTWKVSDCGIYTYSCLKYRHIISMLYFTNLSFVLLGRYRSLVLQHCLSVPSLCPNWSSLWDLEESTPFRWLLVFAGTTERVCLIQGTVEALNAVHGFIAEKIREMPQNVAKTEPVSILQPQTTVNPDRIKQVSFCLGIESHSSSLEVLKL